MEVEVEVVEVVEVGSLQPHQPGVLQVVVVVVVVVEVEVEVEVVVIGTLVVVREVVDVSSSRQPHHPGVLHVEVRLRVLVDEVDGGGDVAVLLLLPSTSFQSGQSTHSGVNLHSGTVSYTLMICSITVMILCDQMCTPHP